VIKFQAPLSGEAEERVAGAASPGESSSPIQVPKGLLLANNRHKYLDAPKLRDPFCVNHVKIQIIDYHVFT
jgi:hypothetical protein